LQGAAVFHDSRGRAAAGGGGMNYYPHNIGDYAAATRHLSLLEHGVYRSLLDLYYLDEQPLPADPGKLCRLVAARGEEEKAAVRIVAEEFFQVVDGLLRHKRCDAEIAQYQLMAERNRINGRKGGKPRQFGSEVPRETIAAGIPDQTRSPASPKPNSNPDQTNRVQSRLPKSNPLPAQIKAKQEPVTKNQKEEKDFCTQTPTADPQGESADPQTASANALANEQSLQTGMENTPGAATDTQTPEGEAAPNPGITPTGDPKAIPTPTEDQKTATAEEKKRRRTYMPKDFGLSERVRRWAMEKGHDRLEQRLEYFTSYARRCAAKYADWDEALMASIRDDWAKFNAPGAQQRGPSAQVSFLRAGDVM